MAKANKELYICSQCAYESTKWYGQCPDCSAWGSLEKADVQDSAVMSSIALTAGAGYKISDVSQASGGKAVERYKTNIQELDRVLGGGFVPAEVVLLSGEPGVGKSTLLLQTHKAINDLGISCLYVSAEESIEQVALRARRLFGEKIKGLQLASAFDVESILQLVAQHKVKFLIVDSIQTVYSQEARGLPGGVSQIKAASSKLITYAKQQGVCMVLVGQVTKDGVVAGPKLLEHLVDALLHLEGDEKSGFRVLRTVKNRFGSVNEVGLFEMAASGMEQVADPSAYLTSKDDTNRVGVVPTVILEGNRPIILDVQALVVNTPFSLPKRVAEGIGKSKLELLCAIVSKYTSWNLADKDIYINVAGGIKPKDTAVDLAVVMAIISSVTGKTLPKKMVAYGDVALTGVIKSTVRNAERDNEVGRLGYKSVLSTYGLDNVSKLSQIFKK